ncbi:hypothetical protein B0H11DRAFT_2402447 [Mycena galericulata]|nr:hypothetical protein B0H11DRAFT_2410072 [Mycena galericulata]KAJ7510914.1 hypothetical protein B0H11DRAFT_2402447 [Mycena galericulata]
MPALLDIKPTRISIAGHVFSSESVHRFFLYGGLSAVLLLGCYFGAVAVSKFLGRRRKCPKAEPFKCRLAGPIADRLRPNISMPESPFAPRPLPASQPIAFPAPARRAAFSPGIHRYPGNCWQQEYRSLVKPISQYSETGARGREAPSPRSLRTAIRNMPDSQGPIDRVGMLASEMVKVKASIKEKTDTGRVELYKWGTVTHTLEMPLRGNKMARQAFAKSKKHNITTNVVFSRDSPFYTATEADKENLELSPLGSAFSTPATLLAPLASRSFPILAKLSCYASSRLQPVLRFTFPSVS